jgi:hypothetical protein
MSVLKNRFCAAKFCKKIEPIIENEADSVLKWCARCKVVRYCSKDCQLYHYGEHQDLCRISGNITKKAVDKMSDLLKSCKASPSGPLENLFETQYGDFWNLVIPDGRVRPRDYIETRVARSYYLWLIADKHQSYEAYDVSYKK